MNPDLISKARIIGKRLIDLTIKDGKERFIFFNIDEESILFTGDNEGINSGNAPKTQQDKLSQFLENRYFAPLRNILNYFSLFLA
jgi:hypothetical protein